MSREAIWARETDCRHHSARFTDNRNRKIDEYVARLFLLQNKTDKNKGKDTKPHIRHLFMD